MISKRRFRSRSRGQASALVLCSLLLGGCGMQLPSLSFCGDEDSCGADVNASSGSPFVIGAPSLVDAGRDLPPVSAILAPDLISKLKTSTSESSIRRLPAGAPITLSETIRRALKNSPQLGLASATRAESEAAVDGARAAFRPTFDLSGATGQANSGTFRDTESKKYWDRSQAAGSWRNDLRLSSTLLLYDFGAADSDLTRASRTRDAANLRESAMNEDVSFSAAQLFVKIIQGRDLLALADENLAALRAIADLISSNAQDGNATQADMKRVEARLLDAESTRADQEYDLKLSTERFIRLTATQPGVLVPAPALEASVPPSPSQAITEAMRRNPMIAANAAVIDAARAEAEALRLGQKPKVNLETTAGGTGNTWGASPKTELDLRGMLTFSYKIADGGLSNSRFEQANARLLQAQLRDVDARETLELDIRQQYLQFNSTKSKRAGLIEGVKASTSARELYKEQFRGGKRTLLELLEIQNAYYTARYNEIVNGSDLLVAGYGILRSTGQLTNQLLNQR